LASFGGAITGKAQKDRKMPGETIEKDLVVEKKE